MGSVLKTKNSWAIKYDLPGSTRENRKQKYLSGFKSNSEAKKALTDIEYKINHGIYIDDKGMTIFDFFNIWFIDHVSTLSPKTRIYYTEIFKNEIEPHLPNIKLRDIRVNHINSFYNKLRKKGVSDDRLFKTHKTLQACIRAAYKWQYMENNIMDHITVKKPERPKREPWNPDEIKLALNMFHETSLDYHVYMSIHLGLRQGEVCGLMFEDINHEERTITIHRALQSIRAEGVIVKEPKTKSSIRTIPLQKHIYEYLCNLEKKIKANRLFLGANYNNEWYGYFSVFENGDIQSTQYVCRRFNEYVKKMELRKITFHDLRHSCASWLLSKNVDIKTIQEILGHTNYSTTADIYSHVDLSQRRAALDKLN